MNVLDKNLAKSWNDGISQGYFEEPTFLINMKKYT